MDFRYVDAFIAVSEHSSFSKAAQALGIAQPAVSRKIRLLEESLKTQLFIRSSRQVVLTTEGENLFRHLKQTSHWIQDTFHGVEPELRIGGVQGILDGWLAERLSSMKVGTLSRALSIRSMSNDDVFKGIAEGKLDIGLTHSANPSSQFHCRRIYSEELCLISKTEIDTKKLHEHCWISGFSASYLETLAKNKRPTRVIRSSSLTMIFRLVERGHGIAIVPQHLIPSGLKIHKRSGLTIKASQAFLITLAFDQVPKHIERALQELL